MDIQNIIFTIAQSAPGFILAIVVHEWAHGYVAKRFGDNTAERAGRLTLNPAVHVDTVGTIIFPLIGILLGGMAFGWAKPVPVESRNFKNIRKGIFWVSFAGPLANLFLAVVSALLFVFSVKMLPQFGLKNSMEGMLQFSIFINCILMGFNLIPLPPLDGSRMVSSFLKGEALRKYEGIARFTPLIFIAAIFLSFQGVHTFGYILKPFLSMGYFLINIFDLML
ncbi:MAG: site-2 protease family protein [Halobacteriovoraceae bacterium]|nr:site-2 protease family protein [Halobacteriovoraceae bacterium]|tara:strand:+ start:10439 stop:11107 length:669 start_codon:yes stop_codon:yes gene_type:complete